MQIFDENVKTLKWKDPKYKYTTLVIDVPY